MPGNFSSKRADHGELPLKHPQIDKLLDRIHFVKNYKSELYNLVALPKSKSETCIADAMRLSCNLAYMIAQCMPTNKNKDCTFKDFKKAGKASFEHRWNNHKHCGLWYQARSWMEEEKVEGKGKYQDKVKMKKSTIING